MKLRNYVQEILHNNKSTAKENLSNFFLTVVKQQNKTNEKKVIYIQRRQQVSSLKKWSVYCTKQKLYKPNTAPVSRSKLRYNKFDRLKFYKICKR